MRPLAYKVVIRFRFRLSRGAPRGSASRLRQREGRVVDPEDPGDGSFDGYLAGEAQPHLHPMSREVVRVADLIGKRADPLLHRKARIHRHVFEIPQLFHLILQSVAFGPAGCRPRPASLGCRPARGPPGRRLLHEAGAPSPSNARSGFVAMSCGSRSRGVRAPQPRRRMSRRRARPAWRSKRGSPRAPAPLGARAGGALPRAAALAAASDAEGESRSPGARLGTRRGSMPPRPPCRTC